MTKWELAQMFGLQYYEEENVHRFFTNTCQIYWNACDSEDVAKEKAATEFLEDIGRLVLDK